VVLSKQAQRLPAEGQTVHRLCYCDVTWDYVFYMLPVALLFLTHTTIFWCLLYRASLW